METDLAEGINNLMKLRDLRKSVWLAYSENAEEMRLGGRVFFVHHDMELRFYHMDSGSWRIVFKQT